MEDRLKTLLEDQKKLFIELNGVDPANIDAEEKQALFNKFILALHEEATELLKTTPYKSHDKKPKQIMRSNTVLEVVDVFKYLMNICVLMGIDADELYKVEREKTIAVRQRYQQQQIDFSLEKVLMVDVDGVLADYPNSFYDFINQKLGTKFNPALQHDYDFCKVMGIDRKKYEELKHEYRESGYKRYLKVIPGSKESLDEFKRLGYKIVIFTARPVSDYNRIETDTLFWLNENKLPYDMVLFAEKKHEELAKFYKNVKPVFFFEDSESNALALADDGIKVILFNKPHHKYTEANENIVRVNNWDEARVCLKLYKE